MQQNALLLEIESDGKRLRHQDGALVLCVSFSLMWG